MTQIFIQAFQAIILLILFFSGIQILLFGIVGEYLGRIFTETKNRPLYLVDEYNGEKEMNDQLIKSKKYFYKKCKKKKEIVSLWRIK